jgi:hypothetical protein
MIALIAKKVLAFSAGTILVITLLMVDLRSSTLVSEAHACDPDVLNMCLTTCWFQYCALYYPDDPQWCFDSYCVPMCLQASGC